MPAHALLLLLAALLCATLPAHADDGRVSVVEEDDSLYFHSDRHYTQGARLSYLAPDTEATGWWDAPFALFDTVGEAVPGRGPSRGAGRHSLFLGQSLFTPGDLSLRTPSPDDRPYAGWLYGGASLMRETGGDVLDNLDLVLGVVGPAALGAQAQNGVHHALGFHTARGWPSQLDNEPGLMLSFDRRWRLPLLGGGSMGLDAVPEAGVTVGNVFTYADAGVLLRAGTGLDADYGPARVRPALSGSDWFDSAKALPFAWYAFVGVQGRAVAHNIFLDGNTFRDGPSVTRQPLVGDLQAGLSLLWDSRLRLDFAVGRRTPEFEGQASPDLIAVAALTFGW